MDTTIRNLDEDTYRAIKAKAALEGKTVGEVVNEALRVYLARPSNATRKGSILDIKPERYGKGSERLSEEIDRIVYGV